MNQGHDAKRGAGAGWALAGWAFAGAVFVGWALLAGCSLIVDSKLAGRADGGAPADMPLPPDTGPGPGPGMPTVKIELRTPTIWIDGGLAFAVHVEHFMLRPEKMGHPPSPGEGHYTVALDNGEGFFLELPPGGETEYSVDFGGVGGKGVVALAGPYKLTVTLVDNSGAPLVPPATDTVQLEICGPDYASDACGSIIEPPVLSACAPQDGCLPACDGPCPACVRPGCPAAPCVDITTIAPVVVAPGAPMLVELTLKDFALSYPWYDPPPPSGKEGYYRIFLAGDAGPLLLAEGSANPTEVQMRPEVTPRDVPYLLQIELVNPDGTAVDPPRRACWPIFVAFMDKPMPEPTP